MEGRPFTTLFVTGNHENYEALRARPAENWHGGKIRHSQPSVFLLERGQIFEICGRRIFTIGGASSHDIQDGILELDESHFEQKFQALCARDAVFRINHILMERRAAQPRKISGGADQSGRRTVECELHHHPPRPYKHPEQTAQGVFQTGCAHSLPEEV